MACICIKITHINEIIANILIKCKNTKSKTVSHHKYLPGTQMCRVVQRTDVQYWYLGFEIQDEIFLSKVDYHSALLYVLSQSGFSVNRFKYQNNKFII